MTRWIEPSKLWDLVQRDSTLAGDEAPETVILKEPELLIRVAGPALPPLDVDTYVARLTRWQQGEGPRLVGMDQFVRVLTSLKEPGCAVAVKGNQTSYTYLLDSDLTRVIAAVAIDPPPIEGDP
jgi:hypothetical protein